MTEMLDPNLRELAKSLIALQGASLAQLRPLANQILATKDRNVDRIEQVLDRLLDGACCIPEGLEIYRRLCRHLWFIDQNRAAKHVYAYRDVWGDPDDKYEPLTGL